MRGALEQPEGSTAGSLAWFTVFQFVATYGVIYVTPYVVASVFDVLRLFGRRYPAATMYSLVTGTPYFPIQIVFALLVGLLMGRHFRQRTIMWVWVIPLAFLLYALIAVPTFLPSLTPKALQAGIGQSRLSHYFGWGCRPIDYCLDEEIATLPLYVSLSYSLGAFLARRMPDRLRRPNPKYFWIYLLAGLFFLTAFCSGLVELFMLFRRGVPWQWGFIQPLAVTSGLGSLLILYSSVVANQEPSVSAEKASN